MGFQLPYPSYATALVQQTDMQETTVPQILFVPALHHSVLKLQPSFAARDLLPAFPVCTWKRTKNLSKPLHAEFQCNFRTERHLYVAEPHATIPPSVSSL